MDTASQKVRGSVLPCYGAAAVWVVRALAFDLYRVSHFAFTAVLSLGVYLLLRALCGGGAAPAKASEAPEAEPKKPEATGNPELDKMLDDGRKAISEMKRLDDAIEDEKISADIRRLEASCQQIFAQVKASPDKLPQIRKFMNYYLPTTLKLLNAYDRMDAAGVSGANIDGAKGKIEDMLDTICTAFTRQLDDLYGEEAMDVSAEIKVMEQMLAQEGLGGMTLGGS